MHECIECGAWAAVVCTFTASGAGYGPPGTECIVTLTRFECARGHQYDLETGSVEF